MDSCMCIRANYVSVYRINTHNLELTTQLYIMYDQLCRRGTNRALCSPLLPLSYRPQ